MNSPAKPDMPIIFLHGWGMNRGIWQHTIEQLPSELRDSVVNLDLPGYGENRNSARQLSELADWLESQLQPNSVVVAWSLAGLVGLECLRRGTSRIRQLVLVASSAKFAKSEQWPGIDSQVLAAFQQQLLVDRDNLVSRFLAIQAMGSETAKQDIKKIKQQLSMFPAPQTDALKAGLDILNQTDLRSVLVAHADKVTLILGRLDALVPIAQVTALACDELNVIVMDKASHAPFISHPTDFVAALIDSIRPLQP